MLLIRQFSCVIVIAVKVCRGREFEPRLEQCLILIRIYYAYVIVLIYQQMNAAIVIKRQPSEFEKLSEKILII
jgi:hypothetical protein